MGREIYVIETPIGDFCTDYEGSVVITDWMDET